MVRGLVNTRYRGRFAPTPSGPLHLGSLYTALASYLHAKAQSGVWLVRIDDLDVPRCIPGMDLVILRQLAAHGLHADEPVRYQSAHTADYRDALDRLQQAGLLYPCNCTRAQLVQQSLPGPDGPVYAGACRSGIHAGRHALRLKVADSRLCFEDGNQGRQCRRLAEEVGDFVVKRTDGHIAYQLACAVDEAAQGITEVVRGSDLLGSTFRQLHAQQLLGLPYSRYRHLAVLVDAGGRKLSKQNRARPLDTTRPGANLVHCLQLLGQDPPEALRKEKSVDILAWAVRHWDVQHLSNATEVRL